MVSTVYFLLLAFLALKELVNPGYLISSLDWVSGTEVEIEGKVVLWVNVGMALLLSLFFLTRLWNVLFQNRRFVREGGQGPIEVSSIAIEDFIRGVLSQEPDLKINRILLNHAVDDAMDISINVSLNMDASLVDTAARLQQQVKRDVEHRLGIEVQRVTVFAKRIDGAPSSTAPAPSTEPLTPPLSMAVDGPEQPELTQTDDREDDENAI